MLDLALVGAVAITSFALFLFVYIRENAIEKKLKLYEKAIETLHQAQQSEKKPKVKNDVPNEFNDAANLIIDRFKVLVKENAAFKESILERLTELENCYKSTQMPSISASHNNYETRIIQLFENGLSADAIADELRISVGEVELALNLNGLKR